MLVMAFITDVTERRRAADELQSQRDFAQQVMNTMGQGLTVSDARGRYEYVNPAFARMIGQTPNATIGRSILDFAAPEERDRFARSHALLRAGRMVSEEVTLYDVNGRPLPVLLTCVPRLRNITVVTDLAERKQIEQAIEWARDRAIEASRLKSDFLANMSHEIRTPLNSIIGLSEMLGAMPLGQTEREYTEIILESGKALLALIDDILDFSKIEAGKMVLEQRPLDLRQCVEGALDVVSPRALQKGLDLAYLIEDTTPQYIVGDGTRLRQILLNLIGNAVKFTERGEVTLAVRAVPLDPTPGGHKLGDYELHFAVQDTGLGIPQERQERLFQSFSQVDASTTRRYGGTGLGLAISRRLCEAMGGVMWVESAGIPGQGATFHFTLPVKEATDTVGLPPGAVADTLRPVVIDPGQPGRRHPVAQPGAASPSVGRAGLLLHKRGRSRRMASGRQADRRGRARLSHAGGWRRTPGATDGWSVARGGVAGAGALGLPGNTPFARTGTDGNHTGQERTMAASARPCCYAGGNTCPAAHATRAV
jgi:PAS domain S-box-containing protein